MSQLSSLGTEYKGEDGAGNITFLQKKFFGGVGWGCGARGVYFDKFLPLILTHIYPACRINFSGE